MEKRALLSPSPQRRLGPITSIVQAQRYPDRRDRLQHALERRWLVLRCRPAIFAPLREHFSVAPLQTVPPRPSPPNRHPELGSGSISRLYPSACVARWMLKRVQHDVFGGGKRAVLSPSPHRVSAPAIPAPAPRLVRAWRGSAHPLSGRGPPSP